MADVSRHRGDMATHPDVREMRERFARTADERDVALVDAPVLLTGLYCAISPWVVNFSLTRPDLAANNLIMGIAIGLTGLVLSVAPARAYGLSWAMIVIGVWLIVSPWIVTSGPTAGMIWNNIVVGVLTCLFGLLAASRLMKMKKGPAV
ncbi:SPW repeat protein [Streptomyces sp. NPDC059506]|uniref:SPW repeat protein n=1 Tax=Streptomyces sp. NPDC059506 TaxID=3347751 RepID=UPI00367939B5